MNTTTASVTEVARKFSDYINRACYGGEHFLLTRGGKPVAEINPLPKNLEMRELPKLLASLPKLSAQEADAFANEVEHARSKQKMESQDPWDA